MSFSNEIPSISGRQAVDAQFESVGKVTDVLFGDVSSEPRWAVVKTGLLGGEHYVPLSNSYIDQRGRLVVPFDKTTVKHAPKAHGDHVMTRDLADELQSYWGVAA
ncbi:MAG TPA: PRC-barrel domain-containing protein [Acidimicrobiia bacterium]|nr:PRC-barrel domain-containing protein [Acidimicrobiia bacterium]